MKSSYSPNTERFRTLVTVSVAVVFLLSIVSHLTAQESAGTQEAESQRIYRQAYEAAMAGSPDQPGPSACYGGGSRPAHYRHRGAVVAAANERVSDFISQG